MGTGGVPTRPGEGDVDLVAGGGDRADPQADRAGVDARVAVQGEDLLDPVEPARRHHRECAAGHRLLSGLEDQSHAPGQRAGCELGRGAQQDRGVRIVPAPVAAALDRRAVRHVLLIGDRQCVDVGAQRDKRAIARPQVADRAGAGGQHLRLEPDPFERVDDQPGRARLGVRQLRVRMQFTPDRDHVVDGQVTQLGGQSLQGPVVAVTAKAQPVVQAVGTTLPELDSVRSQ